LKRFDPLFMTTTAFLVFAVLYGVYALLQTGAPSAETRARYDQAHPRIWVSAYEPGDVTITVLDQVPVIIWRRSASDIALAKEQDTKADWPNPLSFVSGKPDPINANDNNLTVDHEWFFASALNTGGIGCIVRTRAGDYNGFFDPCRGAHFDLSGRIRKAPSAANLNVISARLSPDGSYFELDLTGLPRL